jgi:hypothetical protein
MQTRRSHNSHLAVANPEYTTCKDLDDIIQMERLSLHVNTSLGNHAECLIIKHRIADARILSLLLSGDLTF